MRIIVCGGRNYLDAANVARVLDDIHARTPITVLVHGGAKGADRLARDWARRHDVTDEPHPADWKRLGNSAGPARNGEMARRGAAMLVAFPGGRGTANMMQYAQQAGIGVLLAHPWTETRA